jgi:hypothetical protein
MAKIAKKYEGTKAHQLYWENSPISATLIHECDTDRELKRFLSIRLNLNGAIYRTYDPGKEKWIVRKLRNIPGSAPNPNADKVEPPQRARRLAFRRK